MKSTLKYFILLILVALPFIGDAHANDAILNKLSTSEAIGSYILLGFNHIIPYGFDHILFILAIFLLTKELKAILWQSLAFTISHTITLGLSMSQVFTPPSYIVEPLIAISILFLALENIFTNKVKAHRIITIFLFGLVHGMGFANSLAEIGLPQNKFFTTLISFNFGVELGQLSIILIAWLLIGKWFYIKTWYKNRIVIPASALIAVISFYWTIERIFFS